MMQLVPYLIIVPLVAAFLIPIAGKRMKDIPPVLAACASFTLAILSCLIAAAVITCKVAVYKVGNWPPPAGISMVADSLSCLVLVTVNTVAFLVAVYSIDYMKKYTDTWKFYALFSLMLAGINGVLVAGDIFNLYVFLEIAAIAGYFLVAFGVEAESLEAAFKYAVMGAVASVFIFLGIGFLYSYTSTLNMADMAAFMTMNNSPELVVFVSVLFLMGFGLKAALVPFHSWLPYAHSQAPAPVSAMLSGVSIKVLGIYALARIFFNVFGFSHAISSILITLAVLSMLVGGLLAFGQTDIKRLFAYSSISQIGYIALGLGVGTPLAIFGALFHLVNHSIFKSLLFLNSGSIEEISGTRDLGRISGIISKEPVTGYTNLIAAFSICGMPPLGGFWSKLIIILACIQANRPVLAFIAAIVSILTLAYYFRALTPALFGKEKGEGGSGQKAGWAMAIPMVVLAVLAIAGALLIVPSSANGAHILLKDAASVLTNGKNYAMMIMGAM
ncbi:MAG: proton-conducting transporter membrane subunit [Candidatus Omnitrophica bacterium]|nr:proton-conducting transporter membrane subunit [Candidatus Omnitrophota bacterium]MDD5436439.1 proton-conducting transporter membrane subunit [Candidatus Omnitrophota bacterium]